jgi:hypothetical protein
MGDAGLTVPTAWLSGGAVGLGNEAVEPTGCVETIRAAEQVRLGGVIDALCGVARARSTIMGLKNYGLKVLWWLVSRGVDINPPSTRSLAMAFAFLADLRCNAAAAQETAKARAFTGRLNDWPEGLLGGAARVPLDAARRIYRHQVQKKRGLELCHVRRILELCHVAAYLRDGRPVVQFAVGAAIGAGFKVFARFDDRFSCLTSTRARLCGPVTADGVLRLRPAPALGPHGPPPQRPTAWDELMQSLMEAR